MTHMTYDEKLRTLYEVAYDYLRKHSAFDGRLPLGHPGPPFQGAAPRKTKPWPGVANVSHKTREQWVEARLDAVRLGDEEPALRALGDGDHSR